MFLAGLFSVLLMGSVALIGTPDLGAAPLKLSILPFRIAGDPDPDLFDREGLPASVQHATQFLFENSLRFPLADRDELNQQLDSVGFRADHAFDHDRATRVCAGTGSSHLLAGSVNFRPAGGLIVNLVSYSCDGARIIGKSRQVGRLEELQRLLHRSVAEACPFARRLAPTPAGGADRRPLDLAVVLDFDAALAALSASGSMARDVFEIQRGLDTVRRYAPEGSRIGTVVLEAGDRLDVLPFTTNWSRMLAVLAAKKPQGDVSPVGLERALEKIEQVRDRAGIPRLLIFSDTAGAGQRLNLVESRMRRLARSGWDLHLFNLFGQRPDDRAEWQRLARALALKDPAVFYGRQAGFLEYSLFLVMYGSRFYASDRDESAKIRTGALNVGELKPIETIAFPAEALTLEELPIHMAARENRKLTGLGPVVSGLEGRIKDAALGGTLYEAVPYRALVKHGGRSFWVRLARRTDFEQLKALQGGQNVYLGLRLTPTPGPEKLTNLPGEVFILKQKDVPRLLINRRDHLMRISENLISPADIWFFLAEVIEVRDARREQDIRE